MSTSHTTLRVIQFNKFVNTVHFVEQIVTDIIIKCRQSNKTTNFADEINKNIKIARVSCKTEAFEIAEQLIGCISECPNTATIETEYIIHDNSIKPKQSIVDNNTYP